MNSTRKLMVILLATLFSVSVFAERAKRPMNIHKIEKLGLEIWTEYNPEWITELVEFRGRSIFTAQTPVKTYPPVAMSWASFPRMRVDTFKLEQVALTTFKEAALNYSVSQKQIKNIKAVSATYGELSGYETNFTGIAHGDAVDVKVFVGHKDGRGPVTMQVFTTKGKLSHISENIRRSWTNIKYLK